MIVRGRGYAFLSWLGQPLVNGLSRLVRYQRGVNSFVALVARPSTWTPPVRTVLARQILFTGPYSALYSSAVGLVVGISVGLQISAWLAALGQQRLGAQLVVQIILLELAPLLTNLVILGRSGSAIAAEIASMKIRGEVRMLELTGVDPIAYLLLPRVLALTLCCLGLTLLFGVCALGGCAIAFAWRSGGDAATGFLSSIFSVVQPIDFPVLLGKTFVPGFLTGVICFVEGLSVRGASTELPQAVTRALTYSAMSLFVVHGLLTLVRYL